MHFAGIFISQGTRLKKARTANMDNLMNQIKQIDTRCCSRASLQSKSTLVNLFQELPKLHDEQSTTHQRSPYPHYIRIQQGMWLPPARLLHPKSRSHTIMALRSPSFGMAHKNGDIDDSFRSLYMVLYRLKHELGAPSTAPKMTIITEYLTGNQLPRLDDISLEELDDTFTADKILGCIKQAVVRKVLGRTGFLNPFTRPSKRLLPLGYSRPSTPISPTYSFPP